MSLGGKLKELGAWKEVPWEYPRGRLAKDAVAVKRFTWQGKAESAVTREGLDLQYYVQHVLPVAEMEDLTRVAIRERDAIKLLERVVELATLGIAYVQPLNAFAVHHGAMCGLIQGWIEQGAYPDTWPDQVGAALNAAQEQCRQYLAWAKRLGIEEETDPALKQFGWKVRIRPLMLALVVVA